MNLRTLSSIPMCRPKNYLFDLYRWSFTICSCWSTFKTTDKGCPEELRWSLWFFYNWEQEWGSLCCCNSWSPATNPFLCNSKQETSQSYFLKNLVITRKLSSKDCNPLTKKIIARLNSWITILFLRQTPNSLDAA